MIKRLCVVLLLSGLANVGLAQSMFFNTANTQYELTNTFSSVSVFNISIQINAQLAPGVYNNPDIVSVTYQVTGALEPGTPSGFPAFDLQREMSGTEFYAQGSSLRFEIAESAVLSDGIQVEELVGNGIVFTFDGLEIDTGRFHPALFELNSDGTGRIQNSNNNPSLLFGPEVEYGEEYITDLMFDPGNTTIITGAVPGGSGGGAIGMLEAAVLLLMLIALGARRRTRAGAII